MRPPAECISENWSLQQFGSYGMETIKKHCAEQREIEKVNPLNLCNEINFSCFNNSIIGKSSFFDRCQSVEKVEIICIEDIYIRVECSRF